jgi:K+-sensing histidine kinase KdpD
MTPRAVAARMLETARRAVDHFHGELYAAYVVQAHLTGEDRAANRRNLALARAQQARVDILHGSDPAATLLAHARRLGITQLFVGHTLQRSWAARLRGTPLDRLIRDAEEMDVRVFPQ